MLRFLRCAAQGGAGLPRFAMGATPERRTARRVAARLVARYNKPIPLRGPLGQRSGGPSKASRRSSQIVNRFLGVWSSLKGCSHYCSLKSDDQDQPLCMVVCRVQRDLYFAERVQPLKSDAAIRSAAVHGLRRAWGRRSANRARRGARLSRRPPQRRRTGFVVCLEKGARTARALTEELQCPFIELDGVSERMEVRAPAGVMPARPRLSASVSAKPAAFPVLTCEKQLPPKIRHASIDGRPLPLKKEAPGRIVVIGDTGCRLQKGGAGFQACNDSEQFTFVKVAQLAAR